MITIHSILHNSAGLFENCNATESICYPALMSDQVTVGKGVADLVFLPVEQYRRDGRVLRGLRKGTQSFLRAITIETLHTSHRVASFVARTLDDVVAQPGSHASLRGLEYYDEQPTGVLDSLEHAYDALAKEVQVWNMYVRGRLSGVRFVFAIPYLACT